MYESERKELVDYLSDFEVRHLYNENNIRQLIAMQLRAMREDRALKQAELGNKAQMKQSAIARLEDPQYAGMTLTTLSRLARAFDVALVVHFAKFGEFVDWTVELDPSRLAPVGFEKEQFDSEQTAQKPGPGAPIIISADSTVFYAVTTTGGPATLDQFTNPSFDILDIKVSKEGSKQGATA